MKYRIPLEAVQNVLDFVDIKDAEKIPDIFALKANDNTMAPRIVKGDRLIIHKQSVVKPHDVVIAIVSGKVICRELLDTTMGGFYILNPWNEKLSTEFYSREEIQIIGKVLEIRFKP